jgi:hypothetical protein
MYLNKFSVRVGAHIGDPLIQEKAGGYVHINHGQRYRLALRNDRNRRCDAEVFIDGKHVGTWRINGRRSLTLERPVDEDGFFTAYLAHSAEGAQVGAVAHQDTNGLVQVTFRPEVYREPAVKTSVYVATAGTPRYLGQTSRSMETEVSSNSDAFIKGIQSYNYTSEVVTGLSGHSGQRFRDVAPLEYAHGEEVTISLRLVQSDGGPRPLPPVQRGNPVPPPVR